MRGALTGLLRLDQFVSCVFFVFWWTAGPIGPIGRINPIFTDRVARGYSPRRDVCEVT